jgi:hypothetical protein
LQSTSEKQKKPGGHLATGRIVRSENLRDLCLSGDNLWQVYVAAHEAQREKALRRAENEAAAARQKLAACQPPQTNQETKANEAIPLPGQIFGTEAQQSNSIIAIKRPAQPSWPSTALGS